MLRRPVEPAAESGRLLAVKTCEGLPTCGYEPANATNAKSRRGPRRNDASTRRTKLEDYFGAIRSDPSRRMHLAVQHFGFSYDVTGKRRLTARPAETLRERDRLGELHPDALRRRGPGRRGCRTGPRGDDHHADPVVGAPSRAIGSVIPATPALEAL